MKILGINSSPRRKDSRTLKLVEAVLDGAQQRGAETELGAKANDLLPIYSSVTFLPLYLAANLIGDD